MSYESIVILAPTKESPELELGTIVVSEHTVSFALHLMRQHGGTAIKITATANNGATASHTMTMVGDHERTEKQFLIDLQKAAWQAATEAAGHGNTKNLLGRLFGQRT